MKSIFRVSLYVLLVLAALVLLWLVFSLIGLQFIYLAVLAFGLLIAVHELGHFSAAKLLGVRVNEFAVGMGPKLLKKQGKETLYTLRLLPFGGFCAMGEDEGDSEDPRAFTSQKRWRRVVILAAGSVANFVAAFIMIVILISGSEVFTSLEITELNDNFPGHVENRLMDGDVFVSINGDRLYYADDFNLFMGLARRVADKEIDLVVRRGGELVRFEHYPLGYPDGEGNTVSRFNFRFGLINATLLEKVKYTFYQSYYFVRLVRVSLAQLFTGAAGIGDMSGLVGIVDTMNTIGQDTAAQYGILAAIENIVYFTAFIGVNLALMNMLPIPALDGGRILFIFITFVIEKIIRRRLNPKYEGYIHTAAMVLLLGFMALILVNDVIKLVGR